MLGQNTVDFLDHVFSCCFARSTEEGGKGFPIFVVYLMRDSDSHVPSAISACQLYIRPESLYPLILS